VNRVRELREERAKLLPALFTLTAVARRMGVAESTFRAWEQGTSRPRKRHARALAKEFGVTEADLQLDESSPEDAGDEGAGRHGSDKAEPPP
jgi:transcriptional regulator with XRE-family HTH domain